jgi:hypothetical protein
VGRATGSEIGDWPDSAHMKLFMFCNVSWMEDYQTYDSVEYVDPLLFNPGDDKLLLVLHVNKHRQNLFLFSWMCVCVCFF